MHQRQLRSMQQYVGFDSQSSELLRKFLPLARPHFQTIVDDFYDAIGGHGDAAGVITGGDSQIQRLKGSLMTWVESVLAGPHDQQYLERHSRIGQVHVRINLPQEFMFTAMNRIRARLLDVAEEAFVSDTDRRIGTIHALNQVLDLELGIMLDSYREDLVERMRTHERLATIGQLAASIGHELRNPLGIVESSVFLLRQRLAKQDIHDPKLTKHVDRIGAQVDVCAKTINDLLALARSQPPNKKSTAATEVIQRAVELAATASTFTVVNDVPSSLELWCDPSQTRQVFANMIGNASQARADGTLTISAHLERGGVALELADDGPGIPKEIQARVFDALFTTKPKGTGLGLSLARRILEAHEGELRLLPSELGAHFQAWFPGPEETP